MLASGGGGGVVVRQRHAAILDGSARKSTPDLEKTSPQKQNLSQSAIGRREDTRLIDSLSAISASLCEIHSSCLQAIGDAADPIL